MATNVRIGPFDLSWKIWSLQNTVRGPVFASIKNGPIHQILVHLYLSSFPSEADWLSLCMDFMTVVIKKTEQARDSHFSGFIILFLDAITFL